VERDGYRRDHCDQLCGSAREVRAEERRYLGGGEGKDKLVVKERNKFFYVERDGYRRHHCDQLCGSAREVRARESRYLGGGGLGAKRGRS